MRRVARREQARAAEEAAPRALSVDGSTEDRGTALAEIDARSRSTRRTPPPLERPSLADFGKARHRPLAPWLGRQWGRSFGCAVQRRSAETGSAEHVWVVTPTARACRERT